MAYLNQPEEDEKKTQGLSQALAPTAQPPQGQVPGQQPEATQPSSTPATMASAAPSPSASPSGSGTFTNLKKYMQANTGSGIASAAAQRVKSTGQQAQKGIGQAQESFGQQMESGSLVDKDKALDDVKGIVGAARQVTAPAQTQAITTAPSTAPNSAPATTPETQETQKPQYLSDDQQKRFADIISAQYAGPTSIRQAGLYDPVASKVQEAQRTAEKTQTVEGRDQILKDVFGKNREYTKGQNRLDSLLLGTSAQGIQQIQKEAENTGDVGSRLQAAEMESFNTAQQRSKELSGIQEQARGIFGKEQKDERTATDTRMQAVEEDWNKLPIYFKELIKNKEIANKVAQEGEIKALDSEASSWKPQYNSLTSKFNELASKRDQLIRQMNSPFASNPVEENQNYRNRRLAKQALDKLTPELSVVEKNLAGLKGKEEQYVKRKQDIQGQNMQALNLSPEEAAILGISSGEGLYGLGEDAIRTRQFDASKVVSKDEVARQQALAQLAGLDTRKALSQNLKYDDLGAAGSLEASGGLDVEGIRRALDEAQQGFRTSAEGANLTGTGIKKVSRGNLFGKKTSTYGASVGGNVSDMLKQAGYDVGATDTSGTKSLLQDKDLLARFLGATSTQKEMQAGIGGSTLESGTAGAGTGAAIGSMIPGVGTAIGAGIGGAIGSALGSNSSIDGVQANSDFIKELESKLGIKGAGAVGQGMQDVRSGAGGIVKGIGNAVGGDVGRFIGGIGSAVGGINTGAMKAYGDTIAKEKAIEDLQRKYSDYLTGQGFSNRAVISASPKLSERAAGLAQLIAGLGKRNV